MVGLPQNGMYKCITMHWFASLLCLLIALKLYCSYYCLSNLYSWIENFIFCDHLIQILFDL